MVTVYVYILDTLADWELGYVTSKLHSGRFFKKAPLSYPSKQLVMPKIRFIRWAG